MHFHAHLATSEMVLSPPTCMFFSDMFPSLCLQKRRTLWGFGEATAFDWKFPSTHKHSRSCP